MQKVVGSIGAFLQWIMGTSICESVNSAANIFLGMVRIFQKLIIYEFLTSFSYFCLLQNLKQVFISLKEAS